MKNQNYYSVDTEKWKYTHIKHFKSYGFDFQSVDKKINIKCAKNEILLHNGKVHSFGKDLLNDNILISDMNDAIKNNQNNIKKLFNKIFQENQDDYLKKNTEFWDRGFFLYFPKKLTQTIFIKNIIDQGDEKNFSNSRNFIHIDKNANCKIIYKEKSSLSSCINNASEIYIENNAKLELINITNKIKESKQIYNCAIDLNSNSELVYHAIDTSGKLIKNNYHINLNKPGSNCYFNGFNIADHKDHLDNYIEIYHNNKNTFSHLDYKIISNKMAKSILYAKAVIKKNSSNSEAHQKNNNIILSKRAVIHSNPQLEIYNDDVKCSHGSTTGQIDEEAIHYMRTRGINEADAKKLILQSFLNDIVEKISLEDLQVRIKNKIETYLKNVN